VIDPAYMISGLVRRGIPEHIARAFTAEAKSEANLDPGINETNPTVPGSRGGFGLMQWTGPRRRNLEAFAAQRGVAVSDPDMQMDFLVSELHGSESRAWRSIQSAQDTVSAARAITDTFLRPGIPRYDTRRKNAEEMAGIPATQNAVPAQQETRATQQQANYTNVQPGATDGRMNLPNPLELYAQTAGLGQTPARQQLPFTPAMGPVPQFRSPAIAIENQFAQLLGAAKGAGKNAR